MISTACAWGEQIRGVILFKAVRGAVAEGGGSRPGQAVGFRILEVSTDVFLRMRAYH